MARTVTIQKLPSSIHSRLASTKHSERSRKEAVGVKQVQEPPIRTINELLVQRARCMPDAVLLAYPSSAKGIDDYVHYTARDLDRFADEAAKAYMLLGIPPKVHSLHIQTTHY